MKSTAGSIGVGLLVALLVCPTAVAQAPPAAAALTRDEMREFLTRARIVRSRDIGKGVTRPVRLTLERDGVRHDAAFQSIDERRTAATLTARSGATTFELNFIDHYRYNLAACALAELVGLADMMPVHVTRRWNGRDGSLSWWVDTLMDEGERLQKKVQPPDPADWNHQMYRMRAFAALTRDTDRNLGNVLITPQWHIVMIDFTRAFRPQTELIYAQDLPKIDRALLGRLEGLSRTSIAAAVGGHLTGPEIDAVLKRRDALAGHFRTLIATLGEDRVLY